MFQVRFHGRGGQGVVTAAELLASAAFREDRHAQAFPSFGSERMGAPVMSFCRIDDRPIRTHEPVTEPDALIIQDPTLLHQADLFAGLGHDGYMLVNSTRDFGELGLDEFVQGFHRVREVRGRLAADHAGQPVPGRHGPGLLPAVRDRLQPRPAGLGRGHQLGGAVPRRRGPPPGLEGSRGCGAHG